MRECVPNMCWDSHASGVLRKHCWNVEMHNIRTLSGCDFEYVWVVHPRDTNYM